jgi:hypothetical protein
MAIKNRLAKLERALGEVNRNCRTCYGTPVAVIQVVYEPARDGPGFRRTGECYLRDPTNRVTNDLRCATCGRPVVTAISVMMFADEKPDAADCRIAMPQGLASFTPVSPSATSTSSSF